jgi:hypothetical protein
MSLRFTHGENEGNTGFVRIESDDTQSGCCHLALSLGPACTGCKYYLLSLHAEEWAQLSLWFSLVSPGWWQSKPLLLEDGSPHPPPLQWLPSS